MHATAQWSRSLGAEGRLRVQNQLLCCGYYSPFIEATVSQLCYARSTLPGCKLPYLRFQRRTLERWYTTSFALAPVQLMCIISGLLCSNYVTYRFGKGMMPRAYRLSMQSMAAIMDNYANQLAEQYGVDAVSEMFKRGQRTPETKIEYSGISAQDESRRPTRSLGGHAKKV